MWTIWNLIENYSGMKLPYHSHECEISDIRTQTVSFMQTQRYVFHMHIILGAYTDKRTRDRLVNLAHTDIFHKTAYFLNHSRPAFH